MSADGDRPLRGVVTTATTTPTLLVVTGLPGTGKSTAANAAAGLLGAPVLGHDWALAGLRAVPRAWELVADDDPSTLRVVGWRVLFSLAEAQLREGRSVVLDGVAREPEVRASRELAQRLATRPLLVVCTIADAALHRARIEGRVRAIPNWPELGWAEVERSRAGWVPPPAPDLVLDAERPPERHREALARLLGGG